MSDKRKSLNLYQKFTMVKNWYTCIMPHINIEIKAKCTDPDKIKKILQSENARLLGTDHQIDTYFSVPKGRLKLREGNIENFLIYYEREDQPGPKQSNITLLSIPPNQNLREILIKSLEVLAVVDKFMDIFFIENVKFHIDQVKALGSFVEIEAIDKDGSLGRKKLMEQCQYYLTLLGIKKSDLLSKSYSDMLLAS